MTPLRDQYDLEILNAYDEAMRKLTPECHGRLDRALMTALTGAILNRDTYHMVHSQTKDDVVYHVTANDCECKDSRAPIVDGAKLCKHQLAKRLSVTAGAMYKLWLDETLAPRTDPMPQDLTRLSIRHTEHLGTVVYVLRTADPRTRCNVTRASLTRIQDLERRARLSGYWTTRSFSLAKVGWVLERADGGSR